MQGFQRLNRTEQILHLIKAMGQREAGGKKKDKNSGGQPSLYTRKAVRLSKAVSTWQVRPGPFAGTTSAKQLAGGLHVPPYHPTISLIITYGVV